MKQNFHKLFFFLIFSILSAFAFADGTYKIDVATNGGSGKARVQTPAEITVSGGQASAKITWSSKNYDYMILGGKKYLNENPGGKSVFTLPLNLKKAQIKNLESGSLDEISFTLKVLADTTAMGTPHEIEYELVFGKDYRVKPDNDTKNSHSENAARHAERSEESVKKNVGSSPTMTVGNSSLTKTGSLPLSYAKEFSVDFYENVRTVENATRHAELVSASVENSPRNKFGVTCHAYSLITISNGDKFLLVPQNSEVPANLPQKTCVLKLPLDKTYLVSSSAMDYVAKLGAVDSLKFSGTKESGWFIDEAKSAMKAKKLLYAGKYSAPDYELLVSLNCNFALENTMIYHNPEVKEKLEELGIPVLVERSGYEQNPLGRLEWIKLYGLLFGKLDEAQKYFDSAIKKIEPVLNQTQKSQSQKTFAFFYVNSTGAVNVRKYGDYISKMIELAGGKYLPQNSQNAQADGKKNLSTETVQFESFYASARDADFLIYDEAISGRVSRKSDLLKKNPLFADFKAYKTGNIYCVGRDFFQRSTGIADFISDISKVASGDEKNLVFLRKVK